MDEIAIAYRMTESEATHWVFDQVKKIAELFTNHAFVDLVETFGPVEAAQWILTRTSASRARFSSSDDLPDAEG